MKLLYYLRLKLHKKKYNISFHLVAIPVSGKADTTEYSPINGLLESILINWPGESVTVTGDIEVVFFKEEEKILPDNRTTLYLVGTTQRFHINRVVNENDRIILYAKNNSTTLPGRIDAVVQISEL